MKYTLPVILCVLTVISAVFAEEPEITEQMFSNPPVVAQALYKDGTPESKIWLGYMVASGLAPSATYGSATVIYNQALNDYRKNVKEGYWDNSLWEASSIRKIAFIDNVKQRMAETPDDLGVVRSLFDLIGGTYVPCALLKVKKQEAFDAFGSYWGGGRDFAMELCQDESINNLPEVNHYLDLLGKFNGEFGTMSMQDCFYGTLMRDSPRYGAQQRLEWSFIPPMSLKDTQENIKDAELGLAYWRLKEVGNDAYLKNLKAAEGTTREALTRFYTKQGLNAKAAYKAAENVVTLLKHQAYGSFSSDMMAKLKPYAPMLLNPEHALGSIQSVSDTTSLVGLLNYALVSGKSKEILQKIEDRKKALYTSPAIPQSQLNWGEALLAKAQNAETTKWLVEGPSQYKLNEFNAFGKTPLMYAIQRNDLESVDILLNVTYWPANPNQPTTSLAQLKAADNEAYCSEYVFLQAGNRTPLMYAAWHANPAMVTLLLSHNANPVLTDDTGQTACAYIEKNTNATPREKEEMHKLLCK